MLIMFTFCDILYLEETIDPNVDRKRSSVILESPTKKCSVTFPGEKAPLINNIGMFTSCTIYFNCIQITKKNVNK